MPVKMGRGWTSVQARLTLLVVAAAAIVALALILSRANETRRIDAYLAADAKAHGELLDRTLELEGSSLATFAADYSLWGEMVRFVETGDSTWASVNIDNGIGTYRANAAWVFDTAGSLVYAARDSTLGALFEPLSPGLSVKHAFGNGHFCHFFVTGPDGPVEIRGATIHPSDDDERKTPVRGYFLAARLWSQQYLAELARVAGKTMRVESARAGAKTSAEIARQSGVITFTRPLPGLHGEPELMLTASLQPGWIAVALRSGHGQFARQAVLALLAILGLTLVLWFWVTRPLRWLRRSLGSGSTTALKPLEHNRSEFGQLAQLVGRSFGQNAALVKEVAERKQAEVALRESERRYRETADALPGTVFETDLRGMLTYGSRVGLEAFGVTEDDIKQGLNLFTLLAPESRARAAEETLRVLQGEARPGTEYMALKSDGTSFPSFVHANRIERNGAVVGMRGILIDITERKQAEEALRASEARYRETADALPEVVFESDLQGNLTLVNRAGREVFGLTDEAQTRGVNVFSFLAPEERERAAADTRRVLGGESRRGIEYTALRKDGSRFPAIVHADRIIRDGQPVGLRGILIDISVRKRAEAALRESDKKYRLVVDNASEAILVAQDGNIAFTNPRTSEIIGYPREELLGRPFIEFIHPDDRALVADNYRKRIAGENLPDRYEFRIVGREGKMLHVEISAVSIDWLGRPATLNFLSDVTERRQAEEALRTNEAQLSNAMEIAKLGYWEYDVVDDVFTFNDHFYAIFGTTAEKVGGYKMSSAQYAKRFVHPDDAAMVGAETRKAIEAADPGFSRQLEHRMIYADGSVGYISVRFFITKDNQGRTVKTYGANQDITEQKQAETEIAQKNTQLVELNTLKNQLLGMAAHDLRNPLSVVSTASAFLLDDAGRLLPEAKRTDFLRRINSSSEFMLRMIDDLLDVAKIEAGRLDLELKDGDLCDLIEENLTLNRMLAKKKDIRLDFVPETGLPLLLFDRGKVEQVLNNLISNALKFSAPNTVVAVQVSRTRGESIVVSVRDHGQGIPAGELENLFKPFSKTSVRSTGGERSTGLGLAICRKIVEGHHGRIWAESEVGKGSTFSFSLPVKP